MEKKFKEAMMLLFYTDPIIAYWVACIELIPDKTERYYFQLSRGNINLYYSEEYFDQFSSVELSLILTKIVLHLALEHTSFCNDENDLKKKLLATHLEVSEIIGKKINKDDFTLDNMNQMFKLNMNKKSTCSYYFGNLPDLSKMSLNINDGKPMSSDSTKEDQSLSTNAIAKMGQNSLNMEGRNGTYGGIVSKLMKESYERRKLQPEKLNIKNRLTSLTQKFGKKVKPRPVEGRSRRNEDRIKVIQELTGCLYCVVDTSGSITTELFQRYLNLMADLSKKYQIKLIQCDTDITYEGVFDLKNLPDIHGRGGTCFDPPVAMANSDKFCKAIIYFTDGYGDLNITPSKPVYWATNHLDPTHLTKYSNSYVIFLKDE